MKHSKPSTPGSGSRPILKICGITCRKDALQAVECGANTLGFVFHAPSPRSITFSQAEEILAELPPSCLKVGVFVGVPQSRPPAGLDVLQLHGLRGEAELGSADRAVWVAVEPHETEAFPNCDLLIDSSRGRGIQADWRALESLERPFILSGGLTPDNVTEAIRRLHPRGVDVSSGVEQSPGRKDPHKVERFLRHARQGFKGETGS